MSHATPHLGRRCRTNRLASARTLRQCPQDSRDLAAARSPPPPRGRHADVVAGARGHSDPGHADESGGARGGHGSNGDRARPRDGGGEQALALARRTDVEAEMARNERKRQARETADRAPPVRMNPPSVVPNKSREITKRETPPTRRPNPAFKAESTKVAVVPPETFRPSPRTPVERTDVGPRPTRPTKSAFPWRPLLALSVVLTVLMLVAVKWRLTQIQGREGGPSSLDPSRQLATPPSK